MSSSSISSTELPQIAAPHLLSDLDLTTTELQEVLKLARKVKASPNHYASILVLPSRSQSSNLVAILFTWTTATDASVNANPPETWHAISTVGWTR